MGYHTDLHIFKDSSVMAACCQDEVLHCIIRFCTAAIGPDFPLMNNNAYSHQANIVNEYLESQGNSYIEWLQYFPDLNPIWDALGQAAFAYLPPPYSLRQTETALMEEWPLLASVIVDHLNERLGNCSKVHEKITCITNIHFV
ncbi:hypothetical protein X975_19075, partial [Stegodyphus mimosarum]